ncbi:MAG: translation initiation factor IF-2 [Helicobacteraceae bacterium]
MSVKISEIALEAAIDVGAVLDACKNLSIKKVKNGSSSVTQEQAIEIFNYITKGVQSVKKEEAAPAPKSASPKDEQAPKKTKEKPKKEAPKEKAASAQEPEPQAPKDEPQEQAKPKDEPIKLAQRKLTIVKKKNPLRSLSTADLSSYISGDETYGKKKIASTDDTIEKKKAKLKKPLIITKKEQGVKLDLLSDRNLVEYDEKDNMIFMPDLFVPLTNNLDASRPTKPARRREPVVTGPENTGLRRKKKKRSFTPAPTLAKEHVSVVTIPENIRVYEFADLIGKTTSDVIKVLFNMGTMLTKNDFLEKDYIEILADEFKVEVKIKNLLDELDYVSIYNEKYANFTEERPPIVTIMGHVDHGKTSLLDFIRKSKVVASESGGITQHIGAYTITKNNKKITFIDTPGHEAFSQMRARGASATDVVIIVVAADDGVMEQTKEAINHAKASGAPMIVAINKIDKPEANADMVKAQLAEIGITPSEWGGDYDCIGVSAKSGQGVEDLLESILIQAELLELRANSKDPAKAVVVESSLEKGRGAVATVIVQNGTLKVGDIVIVGTSFGKIRAIMNERAERVSELYPSEAGEIIGLDSSPMSGEILVVLESEKDARELAQKRQEHNRQRELSRSTKASLEDLQSLIAEGKLKSLRLIVKADVQGTLEAIIASLSKLRNEEVKVDIIHSAVGTISESDIALASAGEHTIILGFHTKPSVAIKEKAKSSGVEIKTYNVIYDMIDDVKKALGGMLSPIKKEEKCGTAEIREIFDIPSLGRIAGCMVTNGEILRGSIAIVYRKEKEIYRGRLESLKRFKDDVKEVKKGLECGIGLQDFDETEPGDIIECIKEVEIEAEFK